MEPKHHGIEFARELLDRAAERDRGVEDARAVEMHGNADVVSVIADIVRHVLRINRAASHVMRVLKNDQGGLRAVVDRFHAEQRLDYVPGENSVVHKFCARHAAGDGGD